MQHWSKMGQPDSAQCSISILPEKPKNFRRFQGTCNLNIGLILEANFGDNLVTSDYDLN